MERGTEKPLDMEVALYFIRLLRAPRLSEREARMQMELYARYAKRALSKLKNPFAICILTKELEKIEEICGRIDLG